MTGLTVVIVAIVFLLGYRAAVGGKRREPVRLTPSRILALGLLVASVLTVGWWFATH